jgi:hypothetical protein
MSIAWPEGFVKRTPYCGIEIDPSAQGKVWEAAPSYQLFNRSDQGIIITPEKRTAINLIVVNSESKENKGRLKFIKTLLFKLTFNS